jgi:steroid 5-alpha reductase family enzyme
MNVFTLAEAAGVLTSLPSALDVLCYSAGFWLFGFAFEAIAEHRNPFRMDPKNKGKFINNGLLVLVAPPQLFWRDHPVGR